MRPLISLPGSSRIFTSWHDIKNTSIEIVEHPRLSSYRHRRSFRPARNAAYFSIGKSAQHLCKGAGRNYAFPSCEVAARKIILDILFKQKSVFGYSGWRWEQLHFPKGKYY